MFDNGMVAVIRQFVKVEAGGIVRVQSSDLREGSVAEVVVLTDQAVAAVPTAAPGSTWASFIGGGEHTGRTVEEIDASIRELRDEWER